MIILYQFSLPHLYIFSLRGWENVLCELGSERVKNGYFTFNLYSLFNQSICIVRYLVYHAAYNACEKCKLTQLCSLMVEFFNSDIVAEELQDIAVCFPQKFHPRGEHHPVCAVLGSLTTHKTQQNTVKHNQTFRTNQSGMWLLL